MRSDAEAPATARPRSALRDALGRSPAGCGPQAGAVPPRPAPPKDAPRGALPLPRHAEGPARAPVAALRPARPRARAQLRCGLQARALPARPLLDPVRPRPPDRRGVELARPRLRHEGNRLALRPRR